jgi:hypothetical protein
MPYKCHRLAGKDVVFEWTPSTHIPGPFSERVVVGDSEDKSGAREIIARPGLFQLQRLEVGSVSSVTPPASTPPQLSIKRSFPAITPAVVYPWTPIPSLANSHAAPHHRFDVTHTSPTVTADRDEATRTFRNPSVSSKECSIVQKEP